MSSDCIYESTKPLPYVYMLTHKVTGEFYIGSRQVNTDPSHIDLPQYRTSSATVKPIFDEFDWMIVAEFFDRDAAYDYEQQMIHEHWGDALLLNLACHYGISRFTHRGGKPFSDSHREKLSSYASNRPDEHIEKLRKSQLGSIHSEERRRANSEAQRGKIMSDESRRKISAAVQGRTHTDETKKKISDKNRGRIRSEEACARMSEAAKLRHKKIINRDK